MIGWAIAGIASAQDCPQAVPAARLAEAVAEAERGYAELSIEVFADRLDGAGFDLPCLDAVVPPDLAARYHRLVGLAAFVEGDEAEARAAFAASRAADPQQVLPEELIPGGHEVRAWFEAAAPGETAPIPPPVRGSIVFDGRPATERPLERPVIVQVVDPRGRVDTTRYLRPGEPLPAYPQLGLSDASARPRRPGWLVGGAVGLATSAVMYGLAADAAAQFKGPLPPDWGRPELLGLRTRTNLLVAGSAVAGAGGAIGFAGYLSRW